MVLQGLKLLTNIVFYAIIETVLIRTFAYANRTGKSTFPNRLQGENHEDHGEQTVLRWAPLHGVRCAPWKRGHLLLWIRAVRRRSSRSRWTARTARQNEQGVLRFLWEVGRRSCVWQKGGFREVLFTDFALHLLGGHDDCHCQNLAKRFHPLPGCHRSRDALDSPGCTRRPSGRQVRLEGDDGRKETKREIFLK